MTRAVTEMLYGIIGPGKSVIMTVPGLRVAAETSQEITIDSYLLGGLNTKAQWYFYEIYRTGKVVKSLTAIISAPFLSKLQ